MQWIVCSAANRAYFYCLTNFQFTYKPLKMSFLFSPLTIKSVVFKNRIVVSPMCQYSGKEGFANDWHLVHLGSRAIGGAGLIMQEATAVSPEGRITHGDLGIYNDNHIEFYSRITNFIHLHGSVPGIQIAHAGRKASCGIPWISDRQLTLEENGWEAVAPSPIPFRSDDRIPHELEIEEIRILIKEFQRAAKRAHSAGYKVIEIHAAHGYLINEFLSPLCNQRTDEYGGSFRNRIRFLLNIVDSVNEVWPDNLPLFVRISASDWVEQGWMVEDSVELAKILKANNVDLIDASSGGIIPNAQIPAGQNYQVPFAARIKQESQILTGAVGVIINARQAEKILADQQADLIFMAREHLRDPYFSLHAAKELGDEVKWPEQYLRGKR